MDPGSSASLPFERIGGAASVVALVERFYDAVDELEPDLARLHPCEEGKVSRASRERFSLFLIGWLGGPQDYMQLHGHPRLRLRHAHVPVDERMRDAWLRCMRVALADPSIDADLRTALDRRFAELANFLRNHP